MAVVMLVYEIFFLIRGGGVDYVTHANKILVEGQSDSKINMWRHNNDEDESRSGKETP